MQMRSGTHLASTMASRAWLSLAIALMPYTARCADEKPSWSIDLLVGNAYDASSRTRIEHAALGNVSLGGDYETRGLESPLHYAWRISQWKDTRAWELQLLHHKIFLRNRPTGVAALSVSHGFNIVTLNRAVEHRGWRMRAGLGPVITHAEARILGSSYDGPYEIAGAAALLGIGRSIELGHHFHLLGEVSATYGYVRAHPNGEPDLTLTIRNPALHAQIGLGYRF